MQEKAVVVARCAGVGFNLVNVLRHGGFLHRRVLRLFLLQFYDMSVNGIDNLGGCAADCFKRAFQFGKLPSGTPPGNIPKGIIRGIKPVMLAHGIGDTFSLYLTGAAVGSVLQVLQRGVKVNVMELRMGDFMDKGF